jgi:Fe-S-cluster containining protein
MRASGTPWKDLQGIFSFITRERIHESLGYRIPHEVYFSGNNNHDACSRLSGNGDACRLIHQIQPIFCLDNVEGFNTLH